MSGANGATKGRNGALRHASLLRFGRVAVRLQCEPARLLAWVLTPKVS